MVHCLYIYIFNFSLLYRKNLHLRYWLTFFINLSFLGHGSASTRRYLCRGQELGGRAHLRPDQGWKDIGERFPGFTGSKVSWFHGPMVPWFHGSMVPWFHGSMAPRVSWFHGWWFMFPWFHGSMVPWFHGSTASTVPRFKGSMVPWFHGSMVPWVHGSVVHYYISSELHGPRFRCSIGPWIRCSLLHEWWTNYIFPRSVCLFCCRKIVCPIVDVDCGS